MKIRAIITGSTGMVGKGVLLECLENDVVESILVINRKPVGIEHPKLKEIIHDDFYDLSAIKDDLKNYNTCYFCLGVSSMGISKEKYFKITHDLTLHFAETLVELNPQMTFCYVSGTGTDSSESSAMDWANVKGKTENDISTLPFKASYMFRPGFIQPMKGIRSNTKVYDILYQILKPFYPVLKLLFLKYITNTTAVGKAMINAATLGYPDKYLENKDINNLAEATHEQN